MIIKRITNRLYRHIHPLVRSLDGNASIKRRYQESILAKNSCTILFVCTGNICRSAFIHSYANKMLSEDKGLTNLNILSAGTHTHDGLTADSNAIRIASGYSVDLSEHRTSAIRLDQIKSADIILAMEPSHLLHMLTMAPLQLKKFHLYSSLETNVEDPIILDPFGKTDQIFKGVFTRLKSDWDSFIFE